MATAPASSSSTVTVGCKLPHGIHMDLNVIGKPLRRVSLRGSNSSRVVGGFGITENVPQAFFDEWSTKNKELPALQNGLIFAMGKFDSVADKASDMSGIKNGFEALDPNKVDKDIETLTK